jgi:asparagine synthase (glutamine-hydrolysing)
MKMTVAVLDKSGGDATPKIIETLKALSPEGVSLFGIATPSTVATSKDLESLRTQKLISPVAVGFARSKHSGEPELVRLDDATVVFEGRVYSPTSTPILELVAKKPKQEYVTMAEAFVKGVEGDFSLMVAKADEIVATRDPVGVDPLYYGENASITAIASNKKALWKLGIEEPKSFPPGNVAVVSREGFKFKPAKMLTYSEVKPITLQDAAEKLQKLLEQSVQMRVQGLQKAAVAFSGGLDSSMVAFLVKKCGVGVQLVHVSLENQPETEEAWVAAEELGLPLQVHLFKEADVEKVIGKVVALVEEPDPIKASIGVPFYWTAEKVAEAGFRVMLAGQGADELFGGYQRYVSEYLAEGNEKVRRTMYNDVVNIHESNIERDEKICGFHDVELRLPFASYQIAEFALALPTELKFEKKADSLRKLVLRKAAENMGLSEAISAKPKKAVQYGTGISNALKRIAKKHKTTLADYVGEFFQKME